MMFNMAPTVNQRTQCKPQARNMPAPQVVKTLLASGADTLARNLSGSSDRIAQRCPEGSEFQVQGLRLRVQGLSYHMGLIGFKLKTSP